MKYLKIASIAGLTLVSSLCLTSVNAATKWDMPTPYGDGVHHTKNVRFFAEDVKRATDNELNIVVHSGASLYKHPEIHRAVRSGQVSIGEMFMGLLGNGNPIFKADNIPFLASDFDTAHKLWEASRSHIEKALKKDGLKLLFAVPWPPQGFYTKTAINSGADIKGMKLRAYSPATSRLAVLLGASPTTVQTPEIPQAFSTGLIDAMVTSPSTGVSSQSWDYVSNYTDTQAWIPKNMVIVNARAFKRLSKENQKAVMDAAAKAESRGWDLAMSETKSKTKMLADKGMNVSKPSAQLKADLQAVGATMSQEWAKEAGSAGQDILNGMK
ncbi:MAG: TRAP transporter substrate-binding protein [Gammaproteobacteria bacterium]|jgi:TRAP-type C4-dicarboxylate transport system substrate-binding protein|nr:TRAP transporter substrate-binding protein [Gammaproteobacteria bacterium]MBT3723480.1 TRAP transporter substrate-binding protein [Gammaproteobacteria bacterium]MBT4076606.1 TRAP transporter substrate-binding protein [Gammaproteobacteria bacterium]MBT4194312.1 TRAP transporter substrate-binding protein [Gammaproteobacteria bacterium]MBT4450866.1 TRAP transporter substrate-binding protein [Gammaproteobacteria bacterium]